MSDLIEKQYQKVRKMVMERRFQEAVKLARLVLLSEPRHVECRLLLAQALISLARYDEVITETEVILELAPDEETAWTLKGEALFFKAQFLAAMKALQKASELRPDDQKVQRLLQEIQLSQQPGLEPDQHFVTGATRSYPLPEEQAGEDDPTDVIDMSSEIAMEGDPPDPPPPEPATAEPEIAKLAEPAEDGVQTEESHPDSSSLEDQAKVDEPPKETPDLTQAKGQTDESAEDDRAPSEDPPPDKDKSSEEQPKAESPEENHEPKNRGRKGRERTSRRIQHRTRPVRLGAGTKARRGRGTDRRR
jgi:tetratricopeptide (TPR) repeat protein